jgi:very-short-patch-repair endonuclease
MFHGFLSVVGILFVAAVVIAVVKRLLTSRSEPAAAFPYQKEWSLFSPAERSFLGVLEQAVGDRYRIMGKVRLADVIKVRFGMNRKDRQCAVNRIQSKHVDFMVCHAEDLAVKYVVELDDQSHNGAARQDRDAFVDQALQAAGVPVFHFSAKRSYAVAEVRQVLGAAESIAMRDAG